jgi:glycerol-3-phosphate dehydrogenase
MVYSNHSPWIDQLDSSIEYVPIASNNHTDIVVVGAGIAGVSTAFQILSQTDLAVSLIEAKKIAHGAS